MSKTRMKLKLVEKAAQILLAYITVDQAAQARAGGLVQKVVWDYTDLMVDGVDLPPVVVFREQKKGQQPAYYLADGFHRLEAARKAKLESYRADIYQGGLEEARLYASGANSNHGLRRSREDKHRAVKMARANPLTEGWSNREIADHCGVSHTFVNRIVQAEEAAETDRRRREAAGLGPRLEKSDDEAAPEAQADGAEVAPKDEQGGADGGAGNVSTPEPASYAFELGQIVNTARDLRGGRTSAFGPMRTLEKGAKAVVKARSDSPLGPRYEITSMGGEEWTVCEADLVPYRAPAPQDDTSLGMGKLLKILVQGGGVDKADAELVASRLCIRRQRQLFAQGDSAIRRAAKALRKIGEVEVGDAVFSAAWRIGERVCVGWGIVTKAAPTGRLQVLLMPEGDHDRPYIDVATCWLDEVRQRAEPIEDDGEEGERICVTRHIPGYPPEGALGVVKTRYARCPVVLVEMDEPTHHEHISTRVILLPKQCFKHVTSEPEGVEGQVDIEDVVPSVDCSPRPLPRGEDWDPAVELMEQVFDKIAAHFTEALEGFRGEMTRSVIGADKKRFEEVCNDLEHWQQVVRVAGHRHISRAKNVSYGVVAARRQRAENLEERAASQAEGVTL